MSESQMVETVDSMDVTGAKIMVGTYPDGSEHISISETILPVGNYGIDPTEEAGRLLAGDELPFDAIEMAGMT